MTEAVRLGFGKPQLLSADTTVQEPQIGYPHEAGILRGIAQRVYQAAVKLKNRGYQHAQAASEKAKEVFGQVKDYHLFAKTKHAKDQALKKMPDPQPATHPQQPTGDQTSLVAMALFLRTSFVTYLTITGESSIGSGVRRVEAFVGIEAFRYLAKERSLVMGLSEALKVQPEQLPDRVSKLLVQLKAAETVDDLKSQTVLADVNSIVAKSHDMWGVGYIAHRADGVSGNDLRTLALEIRNRVQRTPSVVAVVGGSVDKPSVVIVTTQGARDRGLNAGDLVRVASETLGGRGGGKDDIAQGGGTEGRAPRIPESRGVRHRAHAAVV